METGRANNIQSNTFNLDRFAQYQLCVEFGLKNLTYCIVNNITKSVEYFNDFVVNDDIVSIINRDNILRLNFASSSVSFANFPFTLVPNELYKQENLKDILELTSDVYEIIKSDQLSAIDTHLVYSIPSVINDIASTFFPEAQKKAQQTILIEQFSKFDNNNDNAYLYLNNNILNITVFKNRKLVFNNSFFFEKKEDVLYFTLFTFEQLKMDTETVNTILYGNITKGDNTHQLLYEYIRNIKLGPEPNHLNFSSQFQQLSKHSFYPLFSQFI